jgi:uncharacterized protein YdeI (YjbR/CyaY-like superfamily)
MTGKKTQRDRRDPRVDALVERAPDAAKPLLIYLRALVHEAVPDVTEDIKWGRTFFLVDGVILANMVAFKAHCSFGFWSKDANALLAADGIEGAGAGGSFGKITAKSDLPSKKALLGYLKQAAEMARSGTATSPVASRPRGTRPAIPMPDDFAAALARSKKASERFATFSPSCKREYLEWITTAKRQETRDRRVAEAVKRIAAGKTHNEEYR